MARGKVDRRALFKHLKSDGAGPLYYLHGDDQFMLESAVEHLIKQVLPEGKNDFNYDGFRGRDCTAEKIRPACEMLPMLSRKRVVLVSGMQDMAVSELGELTDYFENPAPTTCLVFVANTANKKPDGRGSAIKSLKKHANVFEFPSFREWEVGDALELQVRRRGLKFSKAALALMIESIGTNLSQLVEALERVELYLGPSPPDVVEAEHVSAIVASTKEHNIFGLTESLGARDVSKAASIVQNMIDAGQNEIGMTVMIARHFRVLAALHDPTVRAMNKNEASRAAGIPTPFFYDRYLADSRRFSLAEIHTIQSRLADTDYALKSSKVPDRETMNSLVFDICLRRAS